MPLSLHHQPPLSFLFHRIRFLITICFSSYLILLGLPFVLQGDGLFFIFFVHMSIWEHITVTSHITHISLFTCHCLLKLITHTCQATPDGWQPPCGRMNCYHLDWFGKSLSGGGNWYAAVTWNGSALLPFSLVVDLFLPGNMMLVLKFTVVV